MKSTIMSMEQTLKHKHPMRGIENRGEKPQQHRYERRKVRQALRLSDPGTEE